MYLYDDDWKAIQEFASIIGFKKISEFVSYTVMMVMNDPDLYWIYKGKDIVKKDLALKAFLQKRVDNAVDQIKRQGIEVSETFDPRSKDD